MALRGHPRYGDSVKIIRRYRSLKGNYCVAEYKTEPGKIYYLPEKRLSSESPPSAPKPTGLHIAFSMNALHKLVQLIESQDQRWRVRENDGRKEPDTTANLETSPDAAENTTQSTPVFPNPDDDRRNSR